jgi:hypothetical protein
VTPRIARPRAHPVPLRTVRPMPTPRLESAPSSANFAFELSRDRLHVEFKTVGPVPDWLNYCVVTLVSVGLSLGGGYWVAWAAHFSGLATAAMMCCPPGPLAYFGWRVVCRPARATH